MLPYGPEIQDRQNVWGEVICLIILIQNVLLGLLALVLVPFTGESVSVKYLPMIQHDDKKRLLKDWIHLCEQSLRNAGFFKGSRLVAAT